MTVDLTVTDETTQEELEEIMDKKIETAIRLELTDCLFCTEKAATFERYVLPLSTFLGSVFFCSRFTGLEGLRTILTMYFSLFIAMLNI